jgi:hypothetical protein
MMRDLMYDEEMQQCFLQHAIFVNDHAHWDTRVVVVQDFVVFDGEFRGTTGVFTVGSRGGEGPFDVRPAGDVGNVVEVKNAEV